MAARVQNMTEGKPLRLILAFSLPLMIGNVFQQLYTVVDTMVVGQALGVGALAALGAADWLNWMILGTIQGFTQGFSIKCPTNSVQGITGGCARRWPIPSCWQFLPHWCCL